MDTPKMKTPTLKEFGVSLIISLAPIVIMVLITKPALRQTIKMRLALGARNFAIQQAGFWQETSFKLARVYDKARL